MSFFTAENCNATYYCRCMTSVEIEEKKSIKRRKFEFENRSVSFWLFDLNDRELCIKYCKTRKDKHNNPYIGYMSPWVCKDGLCSSSNYQSYNENQYAGTFVTPKGP